MPDAPTEPATGDRGLKVAYVVVSAGWDRHAQMAWLSATSLRLQDPQRHIVVIVEGSSADANAELRSRFETLADEWIVKASSAGTPTAKSRLHKMRLREYLSGDLLYIDSDTLVVRPLGDVAACDGQVGAVMDFNHPPESNWFPPELEVPFHDLGWSYPLPRYLNAGVILLKDAPPVYDFCREWVTRFEASDVLPHVWDQATFNSALFASHVPFSILPQGYNAIVVKRNYRFKDARVLHFFGSAAEQHGTLMEHLLLHLNRTGQFDRRAYERSLSQQHPWGPSPEPWQLAHSRNYARAALVKGQASVRRAWEWLTRQGRREPSA